MTILQLLSLLIFIAALFGWISSRWLKLPITIGTMLLTVTSSLCLVSVSAYVPGLQPWAVRLVQQINFESLILHGMLALLLFAGAFLLDLEFLIYEKLAVTVLSVVGTLLSTVAIAALMWWVLPLIGLRATWLQCLFFGALISPTDPIAVLEMLRRVGVPKNVQAQLAGESLFNDGIGAVVFLALLDASRGAIPSARHLGVFLLLKAGGAWPWAFSAPGSRPLLCGWSMPIRWKSFSPSRLRWEAMRWPTRGTSPRLLKPLRQLSHCGDSI
jgi:CPA1 family monovalent cation:H+ antiporter